MLLQNSFEGGVNGQEITEANSGGASGDAFDYTFGALYTSAQAANGTRSAAVESGSSGLELDLSLDGAANGNAYGRTNFRIGQRTSGDEYVSMWLAMFDDSDRYYWWEARVTLPASGSATLKLIHFNGETESTIDTENITLPLGTWCRLEIRASNSTSSTAEGRFYNAAAGTTATATVSGSASHSAVVPWEVCGALAGTTLTSASNIWVDDVGASDTDWLGPVITSVSVTVTPSPVTAAAVIPSPALAVGSTITPAAVTAAAVIPTPDVHTGAITTAVNPAAVVATAVIPAPTVDAYKNVFMTPDPPIATAVIPVPTVGVPVNPGDQIDRPGQIEWNGFLLGGSTVYRWLTLEGWWDLPDLDSGNVAHPSRHGAYAGRDLTQERHVTYTALVRARREDMQAVINELKAATRILDDDTELPLAIRVLDDVLVGYGKVARRAIPIDKLVRLGHAQLTIQWTLSDPILQSRELANAVVADGVWQNVTNLGDAPAYPTIRMPGPVTGPTIFVRHEEAGRLDERALEFDLHLNTGETLIIDTYYGTAAVGSDSVVDTLTGNSVPIPDLVLPAGQSLIGYGSSGGSAPAATVLWRHSYL
ncbi:hypothetical protein FLW53_23510 [Microbispora sp. SCL1-1]|uniref:hypothetical protein n=1 Tax=unclassified Microbispora TaxID=2614687 RepID=UPI00115BA47E|nr:MULTISPECIES: hypothetical protein [unclassified Microbispora]NJP27113.1 hypothetical protein [Microbispora sp. CL1-1]TQS11458.1 hypothetical protein FLW53_23510 [Microbispora sp. SCL1-1]